MWTISIAVIFFLIQQFNLVELNLVGYKIIYADDIFTFDFADIQFTRQNDSSLASLTEIGHVSENLLKDSFICYIIFEGANLTDILIKGNGSSTFLFEYDENGSSSMSASCSMYSLKLASQLDREANQKYEFEFRKVSNNQLLFDLFLFVDDVNDNEPRFDRALYEFTLIENNQVPVCVGFIKATDPDEGLNGTLDYYLLDETLIAFGTNLSPPPSTNQSLNNTIFYLNESDGQLCVNSKLDRETYFKYSVRAVARDRGLLQSSQSTLIEINVKDENDNGPLFFHNLNDDSTPHHYFYLNAAENSTSDMFIAWLKAYDQDDGINSELIYQVNNTQLFNIDTKGVLRNNLPIRLLTNQSNTQLIDQTNETIYYTNELSIPLEVKVQDKGTPSKSNQVVFHLKLINDLELNSKKRIRLELEPNRTLLHVRINADMTYHRPLIRVKPFADYYNISNYTQVKYLYQLLPLDNEKNCTKEDVLKLLTLNKMGEIWISKQTKSLRFLAKTMVCSLIIKVIDSSQPIQVISEVEISFVLTESSPNGYILKPDRKINEIMLINRRDATLSVYVIFVYIAILLTVFLMVLMFLFCSIKFRQRLIINGQENMPPKDGEKPSVDDLKSITINKVNMNKLFKWFDPFSSAEATYVAHSKSSSSSSTSTTSCDSSLDQNLIQSAGNELTILKRTSTKIFNNLDSNSNSNKMLFFKSKLKRNKMKKHSSIEDDLSGFNESEIPRYVNKMDQEFCLNSNVVSFRPDFETSTSHSEVYKISNQIVIDCGREKKLDHNTSSFSSFSTSSSLSSAQKSSPEEQLERFEKIYYDNKKYLDTNLSQFLFDITLK